MKREREGEKERERERPNIDQSGGGTGENPDSSSIYRGKRVVQPIFFVKTERESSMKVENRFVYIHSLPSMKFFLYV